MIKMLTSLRLWLEVIIRAIFYDLENLIIWIKQKWLSWNIQLLYKALPAKIGIRNGSRHGLLTL